MFGIQGTWRSFRAVRKRAYQLALYAADEAEQLAILSERLNSNGFELRHTAARLFPKLEQWRLVLTSPLVAASIPWVLRRLLGRPLRRR